MHKLFSTVVLLLLAGGLLAVLAAPAAAVAPTSGQGSSRVLGSSCAQTTKSTGTYARIAGKVRMRELGKQHVVRLRVVWHLYRTATPGKGDPVARHFVDRTGRFSNDVRSTYLTSSHYWDHVRVPHAGLALVARLTWVRAHRVDWHQRYVVATCR